ncbi:putative porin [Cytophaga aurantiaca]|uniref:putative porin n=1 Tax=Cytophaga aurantiaca TaxID=29530 RepID=UPI000373D6D2|nr:putative porin [Cytophaga aurantiaca]
MLGIFGSVQAQILNDTTQQLYGYHSLRYGTEADVFLNRGLKREIDSSLASIQRYGFIYKNSQFSQDLGNWATPLKCVTSNLPNQLGVQTGFGVFDAYEYKADDVKYFDTRSPYAELKYYQGSRGQQSLDIAFSRNINAQWNVGIDLRRIVSKKIVGYVQRNDRQAENYAFDFYVSHHSKNNRYFLLATFNYLEAHNFETGGIRPDSTDGKADDKNDLFENQLEKVWFAYQSTRSLDKRYNYRVYQHYGILPNQKLQVFYRFDYSYRVNRYNDNALVSNDTFYTRFADYNTKGVYSNTQISDRSDFNLFDNRMGLKGSSGKLFYAAYLKSRYVKMRQGYDYRDSIPVLNSYTTEWYLAGQVRRYFDTTNTGYVEALGEYGFESKNNLNPDPKNNSMAAFNLKYKGFSAVASMWAVSPTLLQSGYRSNLVSWDTSFNLQKTKHLFVQYAFTKRKVDIIPSIAYNSYSDLIYFTEAGTPTQYTDGAIMHIQPKLGLRFNLWKIHIYNEFQYNYKDSNKGNGKDILQMPEYVNATQLFIEAWLFKRATLLQTGFDVFYKSSYRANAYNPLLQQYYVTTQHGSGASDFNYVNEYVVVDFFVNMQIRTARLFIKMSNLAAGLGQPKGYFTTPYYTGIPRTVDFGISWRFFD